MSLVRFRVTIKTGESPFKTEFKLSDNGINVMRAVGYYVKGSILSPNHCKTTTLTLARKEKAIQVRHSPFFLVQFSFIQFCLHKEDNFGSPTLHKFMQRCNYPGVPRPLAVPSKGNHCSRRCYKSATADILSRGQK